MERKAHRCRLWKIFGSEQFLRGMWRCFTFTRAWARKIPADATQAKQEGIQGQWQDESLFKVEQVKRSADTDCNAQMMRRAYNAKQLDNWGSFKEECRKEGQLCEWTIERLQEAYDKVALEDIGRLSIAEDILRKSMDFLRRIIAPVDGMGGVTLSHVCPHCSCFPLGDYIWWVSTGHGDGNNRREEALQLVVCGLRRPTRIELGANAHEAKVFKAHAAPLRRTRRKMW